MQALQGQKYLSFPQGPSKDARKRIGLSCNLKRQAAHRPRLGKYGGSERAARCGRMPGQPVAARAWRRRRAPFAPPFAHPAHQHLPRIHPNMLQPLHPIQDKSRLVLADCLSLLPATSGRQQSSLGNPRQNPPTILSACFHHSHNGSRKSHIRTSQYAVVPLLASHNVPR